MRCHDNLSTGSYLILSTTLWIRFCFSHFTDKREAVWVAQHCWTEENCGAGCEQVSWGCWGLSMIILFLPCLLFFIALENCTHNLYAELQPQPSIIFKILLLNCSGWAWVHDPNSWALQSTGILWFLIFGLFWFAMSQAACRRQVMVSQTSVMWHLPTDMTEKRNKWWFSGGMVDGGGDSTQQSLYTCSTSGSVVVSELLNGNDLDSPLGNLLREKQTSQKTPDVLYSISLWRLHS